MFDELAHKSYLVRHALSYGEKWHGKSFEHKRRAIQKICRQETIINSQGDHFGTGRRLFLLFLSVVCHARSHVGPGNKELVQSLRGTWWLGKIFCCKFGSVVPMESVCFESFFFKIKISTISLVLATACHHCHDAYNHYSDYTMLKTV